MSLEPAPLRLAEAVGALSLATDLAMGQPLEHGMRTAMLALRAATAIGLPEEDLVTVYYTGVLHFAGCTAESDIDARFFGDELTARPRMLAVAHGSRRELVTTAMRTAHPDSSPLARAAAMARSAFGSMSEFRKWASSHCDVARLLGARMGLSDPVQRSLRYLYERWDGNGMPGDLRGTELPLAVRLMQVGQDADVAWQLGGKGFADRTLIERAGSGLDPEAVRTFLALGDELYQGMDASSIWDAAIDAEPGPRPVIDDERLDDCLSAVADFADLKSIWTVGHSRAVADLAEAAGAIAGLTVAETRLLRQAALVHDIGRVAVPVRVWARPGPLSRDESERVRLHAYHSERVLDAVPGLRPLARLAGAHGERYDGSGYHRGSKAADLPQNAWLLAAADAYQAMLEPRAHRAPLTEREAADALHRETKAGKFAPDAAQAVLAAAGQPSRMPGRMTAGGGPSARPAGLSERECEVLALLARGMATKQMARQLGISPKTCDHHIQSLYGKIGLSTRAGATLFALEHGLGPPLAGG